ncbi:MAG: secondary thiamine-phosphate synthase enzyme YjbQ [Gammaproteobacteria bacterium]|nr:secondary thiamine-phosphate synthase enzyme YjbQ [Gammaproteobacteria bacterium]MBU1722773.1 secondary thiamine-phosphate synthase enzyme YjbQ [Gammaproteobacteria bacterium]MBU2005200.1 secondary thiamine-phosphate synthase enzyme YjbQ [Gammaproteobacteria bacterium]
MTIYQQILSIPTQGRGTYNITAKVDDSIHQSGIKTGLCHVFIHHTSASLIITENADPDVRRDLETILKRLAPDGDPSYRHTDEGIDDMSAHVRCMLTNTDVTIPVTRGQSALGTWQGLYLYEHRAGRFQRKLTITISGE